MSAALPHKRGGSTSPPAAGELSDDGERYSLRWWPRRNRMYRALFRVITDDGVAVLVHLHYQTIQQRGLSTSKQLDNPTVDDIPRTALGIMRCEGLTPANSGSTVTA